MKFKIIILLSCILSIQSFAGSGGDDSGNGGFAYKQSIKILEIATKNLEHKIIDSNLKDFSDHPEWKLTLQYTLAYDHLQKLYKKNAYRRGRKLAMDYVVNPPSVKILKPYYEAFMGKTDEELDQAALEVEKRLLHEASHIWGFNEVESEAFALRFLDNAKIGETRPTNQIEIKSDFCSCRNGKSDIISDCNSFCSQMPNTPSPILYLNTILGPDITLNPKLGNLYNWCNVQLDGDTTAPQCFLSATDGTTVINNIPVTINPNSNSLTANIQALIRDRTYILKIVEGKTGSEAQSKEIQLRRITQRPDDTQRALKVAPINQYSCLLYGGILDTNGNARRTTYARNYFYFVADETPSPIPPAGGLNQSFVVCHDEQLHPGDDSIMYPRLELLPGINAMWDKTDPRFISNGRELKINEILEERLLEEYGIETRLDLFKLINFPKKPIHSSSSTKSSPLGFIMIPFSDEQGKSFCPTNVDFNNSNQPLFKLLKDYIDDTEALYLAEKEPETIQDGSTYKSFYGTMFAAQHLLLKYAFYIENGLKIKADKEALHTKTIYYYWPATDSMDPLVQGTRKLFTIKRIDDINGDVTLGIPSWRTSDKSIGCIPKITD